MSDLLLSVDDRYIYTHVVVDQHTQKITSNIHNQAGNVGQVLVLRSRLLVDVRLHLAGIGAQRHVQRHDVTVQLGHDVVAKGLGAPVAAAAVAALRHAGSLWRPSGRCGFTQLSVTRMFTAKTIDDDDACDASTASNRIDLFDFCVADCILARCLIATR